MSSLYAAPRQARRIAIPSILMLGLTAVRPAAAETLGVWFDTMKVPVSALAGVADPTVEVGSFTELDDESQRVLVWSEREPADRDFPTHYLARLDKTSAKWRVVPLRPLADDVDPSSHQHARLNNSPR